ncbi:MAG: DUF6404 family protein [Vicinamibacteria bacterium]|jgi:hypothetical protein
MTFAERRDRALALMAQTDVAPSRYAPTLYRWLWRRRLPIRPPHFAGAWPVEVNVVITLLAVSLPGDALHNPLGAGLLASAGVAVIARVLIARRYAREAERLDLPGWEDLDGAEERPRPGSILRLDQADHRDDRR